MTRWRSATSLRLQASARRQRPLFETPHQFLILLSDQLCIELLHSVDRILPGVGPTRELFQCGKIGTWLWALQVDEIVVRQHRRNRVEFDGAALDTGQAGGFQRATICSISLR